MTDLNQEVTIGNYDTLYDLLENYLSAAKFSSLKRYYRVTSRMCTMRLTNPQNMDQAMAFRTIELLHGLGQGIAFVRTIFDTYQIGWDGTSHREFVGIQDKINWLAQADPNIHFRTEKVA